MHSPLLIRREFLIGLGAGLLVGLLVGIAIGEHPSAAFARSDYAAGHLIGAEYRYLDLQPATDETMRSVLQALICSATVQPLIDSIVPQTVNDGRLLRIDLAALGWQESDWAHVAGFGSNPYTDKANPLIVPAGWFLASLADQRKSEAYRRFALGGSRTAAEALKHLKAEGDDPFRFGLVEGASRVNVTTNGARLIEHRDGISVETWQTYDVREVTAKADPLESLFPEALREDASEVFVLIPKVVAGLGVRGVLPVTFLSDGDGKLVASAPVDIVRDAHEPLGTPEIVNPASCVTCHTKGPQRFSVNALRDRLLKGVELKSLSERKKIEAELFHLGSADAALDRWEQDYAIALSACSGLTPEAYSAGLAACLTDYLAEVDLAGAAAELCATPEDLSLAIGYASANKIVISNRLAGLAHGIAMPRSAWEDEYLKAQAVLWTWRGR